MRLWHTDLIRSGALPRQQLLGQWKELNSIFKNQDKHLLINFLYDYPIDDLFAYSWAVLREMQKRGYKYNTKNLYEYFDSHKFMMKDKFYAVLHIPNPFPNKMTDRYLRQCLYNLQEKYDCGGIAEAEFKKIEE